MSYGYRIRHKESQGEYWNAGAKKWVSFAEATRFSTKSGAAMPAHGEWVDMGQVYKQVDAAKRELVELAGTTKPLLRAYRLLRELEQYDLGELDEERKRVTKLLAAWLTKHKRIMDSAPPELFLD